MGFEVTPRAGRLLGALPRPTAYSVLELALLALIAIQAARLFWILVTPLGPVGDWKAATAATPATGTALAEFDPFFRLGGTAGPATVTSLNLKLHGVREDRATGRGSAIIALPDGTQRSFAVGEEIMPGVTLAAVGFDSVTINRGGTPEQIILDQSAPAPVGPTPAPAVAAAPEVAAPPAGAAPIQYQPRTNGGRVDGIIVNPGGDGGQALRAAGLQPGDVIVSVNGQRVGSLEQAQNLIRASGGEVVLVVDRGGRAVPLRARLSL